MTNRRTTDIAAKRDRDTDLIATVFAEADNRNLIAHNRRSATQRTHRRKRKVAHRPRGHTDAVEQCSFHLRIVATRSDAVAGAPALLVLNEPKLGSDSGHRGDTEFDVLVQIDAEVFRSINDVVSVHRRSE